MDRTNGPLDLIATKGQTLVVLVLKKMSFACILSKNGIGNCTGEILEIGKKQEKVLELELVQLPTSIVKLAKRELKFIMQQKPKNIQGIFMEIIQFNQISSMEEHISRKEILAFGG